MVVLKKENLSKEALAELEEIGIVLEEEDLDTRYYCPHCDNQQVGNWVCEDCGYVGMEED